MDKPYEFKTVDWDARGRGLAMDCGTDMFAYGLTRIQYVKLLQLTADMLAYVGDEPHRNDQPPYKIMEAYLQAMGNDPLLLDIMTWGEGKLMMVEGWISDCHMTTRAGLMRVPPDMGYPARLISKFLNGEIGARKLRDYYIPLIDMVALDLADSEDW